MKSLLIRGEDELDVYKSDEGWLDKIGEERIRDLGEVWWTMECLECFYGIERKVKLTIYTRTHMNGV